MTSSTYMPPASLPALKATLPVEPSNFGASVANQIKVVSAHAAPSSKRDLQGLELVCEVVVSEEMLSTAGTVAGACLAYFIDICSAYPLLIIMQDDFRNYTGVSQGMHIVFHSAARLGDTLKITSTVLNVGKKVANMRCEIAHRDSGALIATGVHSKVDVFTKEVLAGMVRAAEKQKTRETHAHRAKL